MAKGKTNQPLRIVVADRWLQHPEIVALRAAGHDVYSLYTFIDVRIGSGAHIGSEPDLLLHPAAHQWSDDMWDFLPAAITAARKRKREGKS